MRQSADSGEIDRLVRLGPCQVALRVRWGEAARGGLTRAVAALDPARVTVVSGAGTPARMVAEVLGDLAPATSVEQRAERAVVVVVGDGPVLRASLRRAGSARVVMVPTTLDAMCDAALSPTWDARADRFRAPALVWCRPDLLPGPMPGPASGPASDTTTGPSPAPTSALTPGPTGLVPVLRNVLAVCPASYDSVAARLRPDGRYPAATLAGFVGLCADVRDTTLCFDPAGRGPGAVLEYGAPLAHALADSPGPGLLATARLSAQLGLLDAADERAHHDLIARAGLSTTPGLRSHLDPDGALEQGLDLVLLDALGHPHCVDGSLLTQVAAADLRAVLPPLQRSATADQHSSAAHAAAQAAARDNSRDSARDLDETPRPCDRDVGTTSVVVARPLHPSNQ
jgi:3-dehydroquinate synthase/2-deoxy-scyllo-inosose synthase